MKNLLTTLCLNVFCLAAFADSSTLREDYSCKGETGPFGIDVTVERRTILKPTQPAKEQPALLVTVVGTSSFAPSFSFSAGKIVIVQPVKTGQITQVITSFDTPAVESAGNGTNVFKIGSLKGASFAKEKTPILFEENLESGKVKLGFLDRNGLPVLLEDCSVVSQ